MTDFSNIDAFLEDNLQTSLTELKKYCQQPSVAAQNLGMEETARMTAAMLEERGFDANLYTTEGFPVVIAERKGKTDKTLLIYNHYDVDGKVYGRGISDDKGHFTSRLFAIDAILNEHGELPCNIKFILEGEEEIGSIHLPDFVKEHQDLLQADACIWEFGGVDHRDIPMQYLGLRGICYVELSIKTADQDVHSGLGGSIFPNPAWRLIWALNTLKDKNEHIQLPGFYDPILPPTEREPREIFKCWRRFRQSAMSLNPGMGLKTS